MTKKKHLTAAVGTGEVVDIVYFGGNQPGTRREIVVTSVAGDNVKARCLATGLPKTFKLSLLEVWDGRLAAPIYDAGMGRTAAANRSAERKLRQQNATASQRMINGMASHSSAGSAPQRVAPDNRGDLVAKMAQVSRSDPGDIAEDNIVGVIHEAHAASLQMPSETARLTIWRRALRLLGWR